MNPIQDYVDVISKVGFPIVVTTWLLWRFEKRMDRTIELLTLMAGHIGAVPKDEAEK